MIPKPNTLDYIDALNRLIIYRERLLHIKMAEDNEEFEMTAVADMLDPWSALTYFRDTDAYHIYKINELSKELYVCIKNIKRFDYTPNDYDRIQMRLGTEEDNTFMNWPLSDVYLYLQMIFEDYKYNEGGIDEIVIENSIIQGQILAIVDCFIYRI